MTDTAIIEALLLRWSDTHMGRTVTLQLEHEGEHPFRHLKCGPAHGQRLRLVVQVIDDDDAESGDPAPPRETEDSLAATAVSRPKRQWSAVPPSQQAAIRCGEHDFQTFLGVLNAQEAAEAVREICGVSSRKDILLGTPAAAHWKQLDDSFYLSQRGMG